MVLVFVVFACNSGVLKPKAPTEASKAARTSVRMEMDQSPVFSQKRQPEDRFHVPPLAQYARQHPKVGKLRGKGSLSIKGVTNGFVVDCKELPIEGRYHKVLDTQARRRVNCGTDELVEIILEGAQRVGKKFEGARLLVGNLSRWGGGEIPYSASHRSGRDVDVGFYMVDEQGNHVEPNDFVKIRPDGTGETNGKRVRLDVAKQWEFVHYLLEQRRAGVQWIFVASHIRKKLLDYAKTHRVKKEIIRKAELVMAQPVRSEPHDDHMHIRIYCSDDDILEGCKDTGSNRPWFVPKDELVRRRVRELSSIVRRPNNNNELADAMIVLARLGRREFSHVFLRNLKHPQSTVRVAAAQAIFELGASGLSRSIVVLLPALKDDVLSLVLKALDSIPNKKERAFALASLLRIKRSFIVDMGVFKEERTVEQFALDALMFSSDPGPAVEALVDAISKPGVDKEKVSEVLSSLTCHKPETDDLVKAWKQFYQTRKTMTPYQWFVDALRREGIVKGDAPTLMDVPALLGALKEADYRFRACSTILASLLKARKESRFSLDPFKVFARVYELISRQN